MPLGDSGIGVGLTIPLHGIGDDVADVALTSQASGLVKKNICLSNDLVGVLDEGNSPLADLNLELLVDGGGVGHVDQSAGVVDDATLLVEADVESTEVLTPPVGGDNKDLLVDFDLAKAPAPHPGVSAQNMVTKIFYFLQVSPFIHFIFPFLCPYD